MGDRRGRRPPRQREQQCDVGDEHARQHTEAAVRDTAVVPYNQVPTLDGETACVIVEPIAANMGLVPPAEGFLAGLRAECDRVGALLIFDEVITGFRVGYGGAQGLYGVTPDLTCLGKIIGGGLPVGAYGGRRDIMGLVAPLGAVYQAGTLSGNPLAMTATRLLLTLTLELRRRGARRGLATACIGGGQGIAMIVERAA